MTTASNQGEAIVLKALEPAMGYGDFGLQVLHALGLQNDQVTDITIRVSGRKPVEVDVTRYVDAETGPALARVMVNYKLVPRVAADEPDAASD